MSAIESFDTVQVGPFRVAAVPRRELVDMIVNWPTDAMPAVMCHLHVGALNHRNDARFVDAMNAADLVYADGMATVVVGRLAGAKRLERAGLTDIGHDVIARLGVARGRPVRLALLGGPDDLAARAGAELAAMHPCEVVYSTHGFHDDASWSEVLDQTRAAAPDIVFVGLGMPREAFWAQQFEAELPAALIMASGGFFGHVAGHEKRAPMWARKFGLEWVWRLAQDPKRLGARYAKGLTSTAALSIEALRSRR